MPRVGLGDFLDLARQGQLYNFNRSLIRQKIAGTDQYFRNAVVLDAGAGRRRKHFEPQIREAKVVVGVDIDRDDLMENYDVDARVVGDLEKLPFESGSFDCIVSVDVVEHLSRPSDFFQEASRTLRPGGILVVCTPNLLGYKNLIAWALPRPVLDFAWRVLKRRPGQPHRTFYRSNTGRSIRSIATSAGLSVERITYSNEITHFSYSYPLLALLIYAHGLLLERLGLQSLLPYLVCIGRKPETSDTRSLSSTNSIYV